MATRIVHAHDHFFRSAMSDKRIAGEFFAAHLPKALRVVVDLDHLVLEPGNYIDDLRQESIADMLFKTTIQGHKGFLYLLVDHQSKPDVLMPFRVFKYICNIMDKYVKEQSTKRIPLVFPLVVYHGKQSWKHSCDIKDLIDAPRDLIDQYFLQPFSLIDLNQIKDVALKKHAMAGVMEFTLKHIFARDMQSYAEEIVCLLKEFVPPEKNYFAEAVLGYILDRGELSNIDRFLNLVRTKLSKEVGEKIMTAAEQLIQRGLEEGLQKGIEQGVQRERKEIINHLLAKGLTLAQIADMIDLTEIDISKNQH